MFKIRVLLLILATTTVYGIEVGFFLYTPQNRDNYIQVGPNNITRHLYYNLKTIILIHGWQQNRSVAYYSGLKNAIFSHRNCNIIEIDYSQVSNNLYTIAVSQTGLVATRIGDFILNINRTGYSLRNVHLIGHSLGGQLSGYVGYYIFEKSRTKLGRITALDPAGPLYNPPLPAAPHVLNRNDAEIVFALHTNRGSLGYLVDCGTIDVYPNDGFVQSGCINLDPVQTASCSHNRSTELFTFAVDKPNALFAEKCLNYATFLVGGCSNSQLIDIGGDVAGVSDGRYFLETTGAPPYRSRP